MTKPLTCCKLITQIRKQLGKKHRKSEFILPYLEQKGWVERKQPFEYKYSLCENVQPTSADIQQFVEELKK